MFDYDRFQLGVSSLSTTAAPMNQNNGTGTLTVATNYRMRVSALNFTNTATVSAVVTLQKQSGTLSPIVVFEQSLAANSTVTLGEDQDIVIDSGYFLAALVSSGGSGAVFGSGEFILE
jgi:hypothetical protein